MKIGLVIYDDIKLVSGGYLYDKKLVEYLNKKGENIEIISIPRGEYMDNVQQGFSQKIFDTIKKLELDVLLQDELCHPSLFLINEKLKKEGHPILVSIVHNLGFLLYLHDGKKDLIKYFEKRYLQTNDKFIFTNNTTKREVEKLLNHKLSGIVAFPGKNHIAPNKLKIKKESYKPNDILRIIFVGNLYPNKGLDILIKALSQVDKSLWILTVVGDNKKNINYTIKIKKLIREFDLNKNVFLKGYISHDKLSIYLEQNHLFIVPSYYESLGIAIIEALGFGLPVIASNKGGTKEIISNGKEGYLIKPGNVFQLREKINYLIRNHKILNNMKTKALEKYEKLPNWDQSMEKIWKYLYLIKK